MITADAYFAHMVSLGHVPPPAVQENADELLRKVNSFLTGIKPLLPPDFVVSVNSGWRTPAYNAAIGGATHSNHLTGQAVDLHGQDVIRLIEKNPSILRGVGLWAEASQDTPCWTHLQLLPPHSGNLVFRA